MRKNLIIKGNIGFLVIYSQKVPVEQSCSSQVELRVMEITQEPAAAAPFHQPLNVSPRHMHRENKTKNKKKKQLSPSPSLGVEMFFFGFKQLQVSFVHSLLFFYAIPFLENDIIVRHRGINNQY